MRVTVGVVEIVAAIAMSLGGLLAARNHRGRFESEDRREAFEIAPMRKLERPGVRDILSAIADQTRCRSTAGVDTQRSKSAL